MDSSTNQPPQLVIRAEEAARMLGIGRTKVYALIATGEIPTIRLGRSVRIPVEGLRAWIAAQTKPGRV